MSEERFLITGAHGCIGAWALAELVREGTSVVGFDLAGGSGRAALLLDEAELARASFVSGDVTERAQIDDLLDAHEITHVIHLAGLQLPYCRADPAAGVLVNVLGTVHIFDAVAARAERVAGLAYASSTGVHDVTLYGAWKLANEGTAAAYWSDHRLPSVGLRPSLVYGVGRDRGFTSSSTKAMLAAALGRPFEITHGGKHHFHYARDAARYFIAAARAHAEGALVFEPAGPTHSVDELVAAIEVAAPVAAGTITVAQQPFGGGVLFGDERLETLIGPFAWTPLAQGVRDTVERFRALVGAGVLGEADLA